MVTEPQKVTNPETGEQMDHYEWVGGMWCEVEGETAGGFDEVSGMEECPSCGGEL